MGGPRAFTVALLLLAPTADGVPQPRQQQHDAGAPHRDPTPPPAADAWRFAASYPRQYITYRLQESERITIDGKLDDAAWEAVNWTEPMEDIAQSFFPGLAIPVPHTPTLLRCHPPAS